MTQLLHTDSNEMSQEIPNTTEDRTMTPSPSSPGRTDRRRFTRGALVGATVVAVGAQSLASNMKAVRASDLDANKALARRVYEAFSTGDVSLLDDVVAADFADHPLAPGQGPGLEGFKGVIAFFRSVFPDLVVSVEDLIAEGDRVAARLVGRGTHEGEFLGIPPTGRRVTFAATDVHRIDGGKIVETWHIEDYLGIFVQLGVTLTPATATPTAH